MKKKHIVCVIVSFVLFLCLCTFIFLNQPNAPTDLTEEAAVDIVLGRVGDSNGTRIIEIEGSQIFNNTDYFVVHAYSLGPVLTDENGEKFQQTYTFNWFYVDKKTGKIYVEEIDRLGASLVLYTD